MPPVDTFVSRVARVRITIHPLSVGGGSVTRIDFHNGQDAWFSDAVPDADIYQDVLDGLQQQQLPVYVAVDHDSREVTNILVPLVVHVVSLERLRNGDVAVQLQPSAARHFVREGADGFQRLVDALERARDRDGLVAVTETLGTQDIIDVTDYEGDPPFEVAPPAEAAPPLRLLAEITGRLTRIDPADADRIFEDAAAKSCVPRQVRNPCIPFLFPDDGCHARAHQMCADILIEFGVVAGKIWLYGVPNEAYRVPTANHPRCAVEWLYHVAPVVRTGDGADALRVIDPSLFSGPVHTVRWTSFQFQGGTTVFSGRDVFDRLRPNGRRLLDPALRATHGALIHFRRALAGRVRALGQAPPYC